MYMYCTRTIVDDDALMSDMIPAYSTVAWWLTRARMCIQKKTQGSPDMINRVLLTVDYECVLQSTCMDCSQVSGLNPFSVHAMPSSVRFLSFFYVVPAGVGFVTYIIIRVPSHPASTLHLTPASLSVCALSRTAATRRVSDTFTVNRRDMSFAVASAAAHLAPPAAAARRIRATRNRARAVVAVIQMANSDNRNRNHGHVGGFATLSLSSFSQQQRVLWNAGAVRGGGLERLSVRCAAVDDDDKAPEGYGDGLSSSFAEELRRRQSVAEDGKGSVGGGAGGGGGDKWGGANNDDLSSAPRFAKDDGARGVETPQLKKSRELQNEGLEGFPTRAGELLKLGLASFLSFGPLIAVFSVLFVGTYLFLGSDFIHGRDLCNRVHFLTCRPIHPCRMHASLP